MGIGAQDLRGGARVSSLERALVDCAARPRLAGGIDALAHGLASGDRLDLERLRTYLTELHARPAARRIGSVAAALGLEDIARAMESFAPTGFDEIELEPQADRLTLEASTGYRDSKWRVRWGLLPDELANSVWQ